MDTNDSGKELEMVFHFVIINYNGNVHHYSCEFGLNISKFSQPLFPCNHLLNNNINFNFQRLCTF